MTSPEHGAQQECRSTLLAPCGAVRTGRTSSLMAFASSTQVSPMSRIPNRHKSIKGRANAAIGPSSAGCCRPAAYLVCAFFRDASRLATTSRGDAALHPACSGRLLLRMGNTRAGDCVGELPRTQSKASSVKPWARIARKTQTARRGEAPEITGEERTLWLPDIGVRSRTTPASHVHPDLTPSSLAPRCRQAAPDIVMII
jgi:hypothetical protein